VEAERQSQFRRLDCAVEPRNNFVSDAEFQRLAPRPVNEKRLAEIFPQAGRWRRSRQQRGADVEIAKMAAME
jgi:hypothetical protein